MIITVASFKGGVGKTTTAVHLAAFFQERAKTVLIDSDLNRSSMAWAKRGSVPFDVVDEAMTAKAARTYDHLIFDTPARTELAELKVLVEGCDMLVIPTTPDGLAFDALMLTVDALQKLDAKRYRILITKTPPKPARDGEIARDALIAQGLPVFGTTIRHLKAFQTAGTEGVLISDVKAPLAPYGWNDYVAIGQELVAEAVEQAA